MEKSIENTDTCKKPKQQGTEKGTTQTSKSGEIDTSKLPPELTEIVSIWPKRPEHIKAAIKLLVKSYGKQS